MEQDWLDQYEVFYEELPGSLVTDTIDIEDMTDDIVGQSNGGLSTEQVSQIAQDTLDMSGLAAGVDSASTDIDPAGLSHDDGMV